MPEVRRLGAVIFYLLIDGRLGASTCWEYFFLSRARSSSHPEPKARFCCRDKHSASPTEDTHAWPRDLTKHTPGKSYPRQMMLPIDKGRIILPFLRRPAGRHSIHVRANAAIRQTSTYVHAQGMDIPPLLLLEVPRTVELQPHATQQTRRD